METAANWPLEECGEKLVSLREIAAGIGGGVQVEFSTTLQACKNRRLFFIREGLRQNFVRAAKALHERGWFLKVEDAYRTPAMQRGFAHAALFFDRILQKTMWELGGAVPSAELLYQRFSIMIATRPKVGTHVSGSAIDVSIWDRATGQEIDRGAAYIEMSELTPMASPFVTAAQRRNREEQVRIFRSCGWWDYPYEFWHFSAGDCFAEHMAGNKKAARYGAVDSDGTKTRPLGREEAARVLEPLEFYQREIQAALARAKQ